MPASRVILQGSEKPRSSTAKLIGPTNANSYAIVTVIGKPDTQFDEAVTKFASDYGLTIHHKAPGNRIYLAGSVGDLSVAFGVLLHKAVTEDGTEFRYREGPILIPAELEPYIQGIFGLDDRPIAHTNVTFIPAEAATSPFFASQVAKIYNIPTVPGNPRAVGIIELGGGFSEQDTAQVCQSMGIAPPRMVVVSVDGAGNDYSGNYQSADGEVSLDVQVIAGIAPGITQVVYFAPNTDQGFIDAILDCAHDTINNPAACSISWGAPSDAWTQQARTAMDQAIQAANSRGIPVFAASGDNGSSDSESGNHTDYPAESPFCIGCGGTALIANQGNYSSESVWQEANGSGTGGGISAAYSKPVWQTGNNSNGRGVPDIAGVAAPTTGYTIKIGNSSLVFGGTSAVAPLWAGFASILASNQIDLTNFLQKLYTLPASCFHDITQGSNGSYQAGPGYDYCTGLGSPNGQNILKEMTPTYQPPVSSNPISVSIQVPPTGTVNVAVPMSATVSGGSGDIKIVWAFGDGTHAKGAQQNKLYTKAGTYICTATASDASSDYGSGTATITVSDAVVSQAPDWKPDIDKPLGPFIEGLLTDPSILDPSKPAGSLLVYILSHPDRFVSDQPDARLLHYIQQYFSYFAYYPTALSVIFDSPGPGNNDAGWGSVLNEEGAA